MAKDYDNFINEAREMFQAVKEILPEKSQRNILSRIMTWQKQQQTAIRNAESKGPQPIFVMRPGLPPRPLDPFYFKLTDTYED